MIAYIDLTYYLSEYKGEVPDTEVNSLIIDASSYIRRQTFDRISINDIPEVVKYATCLIIDKIYEANKKKAEIGNLKSENIEGWSKTYDDVKNIDSCLEKDKMEILNNYLSNTLGIDGNFLLYRGV